MKRLPTCLLVLQLLLFFPAQSAEIFVAPGGSDSNDGSRQHPLASVSAALRMAREMRRLRDPAIQNGIHIFLAGGNYFLAESIFVRPEDSGTPDSPTTIEAMPGQQPVLNGGLPIANWSLLKTSSPAMAPAARGKLWVADLPEGISNTRQLWVNNTKAIRARDRNGDSMNRILNWDHQRAECWIPTPPQKGLENIRGLEFFIHQWWAIAVLRVKNLEVHGDSTRLQFFEPESHIQNEHPWPAPWLSEKTGNSAFYLSNALQFLDEPGEWYLDIAARKIYYWPRPGENMNSAVAIVPELETIVQAEGTADAPVRNFRFRNISFEYAGWLRPSEKGHVPLQAGMYLLDAYKLKIPGTPDKKGLENQAWIGRQPAAAIIRFADHIEFEQCRFEHIATTGLDFVKGVSNSVVNGSVFYDIGGTGIQEGMFSEEAWETHIPYDPVDLRELCTGNRITNNLISNACNEDWGCVGISAGYVRNSYIAHNEVRDVTYSGICVGWGWTRTVNAMRNNIVFANKVHHYAREMYDVGGLYTLSAMPGTIISENYIDSIYKAPYAHDPNHWFYYYLDEGSSYITIKNNWSPSEKVMRNSNGPGNVWENNGPQVADSIKHNAGLEPAYQYLLSTVPAINNNWPINQ